MSDIPEDILYTAGTVVADITSDYFPLWRVEEIAQPIARAILAERERCALIADELDQPGIPGTSEWLAMGNFAGAIRDAILDPHSLPTSQPSAAKPHGVQPPTPCGTPNPAGEP